jgi:carbonic anhydrase
MFAIICHDHFHGIEKSPDRKPRAGILGGAWLARLICFSVLGLAALIAVNPSQAQTDPSDYGDHQTPINIIDTAVTYDPAAPTFGDTSSLTSELTFSLKNTTGSPFCPTTNPNANPNSQRICRGYVDNRWGSLKVYPVVSPQIWFGGDSYHLLEFHFHAPAEHLVNSILSDMEVHFVFTKDGADLCSQGGLLVIGQRILKGSLNPELDNIFGSQVVLPTMYQPTGPYTQVQIKISNVLSGLDKSYRYAGSLTAPFYISSCGNPPGNPVQQLASGFLPENVSWVLLEDTIQMSEQQIARFEALFPNGDARGPQALAGREVTKTTP